MCSAASNNELEKPLWDLETTPMEFFRTRVLEAEQRQNIRLKEDVEFYLVNLLVEFLRAENAQQADCLALTMARALESPYGERVLLFKQLGDTSLYFAGFFQEFFSRKGFDISYYITMGSNAYEQLASLMRGKGRNERNMSIIYSDLANAFRPAVEILLDVSAYTLHQGEPSRNTLSLYEAWLDTASQSLEQELCNRGIIPVPSNKKTLQ